MQRTLKFRIWNGAHMSKDLFLTSVAMRYVKRADVIMQSTGHLDRNGVEIYEGDIVQLYHDYGQKCGDPRVVGWKRTRTYTGFNIGEPGVMAQEVLGNVFETPEIATREAVR